MSALQGFECLVCPFQQAGNAGLCGALACIVTAALQRRVSQGMCLEEGSLQFLRMARLRQMHAGQLLKMILPLAQAQPSRETQQHHKDETGERCDEEHGSDFHWQLLKAISIFTRLFVYFKEVLGGALGFHHKRACRIA